MIVLIVFLSLFLLYLLVIFDRTLRGNAITINLHSLMATGWLLYGILPSIVAVIASSNSYAYNLEFSSSVLIALFCWLLGYLIYYSLFNQTAVKKVVNKKEYSTFSIFILLFFASLLFNYYCVKLYGSIIGYLAAGYGNFEKSGISSLTSSIPFVIAGILFSCLINKKNNVFVLIYVFAFVLLFMLGGNRNIATFIMLGALIILFYGKRINLIFGVAVLFVAVSLASLIAVTREYAVISIVSDGSDIDLFEVWMLNLSKYNGGEFGVMYRHVGYAKEMLGHFDTSFIFSYFVSPIINMIPTSLWPDRPLTNSTAFTFAFWGGQEASKSGLGFSVLSEAKLSLGSLYFVVFLVFGVVFSYLNKKIKPGGGVNDSLYYFFYIAVCSSTLNFFRNDFAIYIKFILIVFITLLVIDLIKRIKL